MEPRILEKGETALVGMVSLGGDIGALWERFSPHESAIEHRVDGAWYELHVYPKDRTPGAPFYMVAVEVTKVGAVPDDMFVKPLPASRWAAFSHRPGQGQPNHGYDALNEAVEDWLAAGPYDHACNISLQVYDARFKGMDDPESELDLLIPIVPKR
jgi:predicted transcriptional regulator YdeE